MTTTAPDPMEMAVTQYLTRAAETKTAVPDAIVYAMAERMRAGTGERAKYQNVMCWHLANQGYIQAIGLAKTFGMDLMNITPYPGHGSVSNNTNNFQYGVPIQPPAPPQMPQLPPWPTTPITAEAVAAATPPARKAAWWYWLLGLALLGTTAGLGGYLYAVCNTPPTPPSAVPIDPSVGIEIDG
jgi:hypothetical protein